MKELGSPGKLTKIEVLQFINNFIVMHDQPPTVDDIAEKLGRPRKVMADFLSRYARYGIVEPFKAKNQKTRYGPGINWAKVDHLEWADFFRAGPCPHCGHKGVLGFLSTHKIHYRCKWCDRRWSVSRELESMNRDLWSSIGRQAEKTRRHK